MKCYKRLMHVYKQFVQVSGLCGPQFLSNWCLPKCFTQLCRVLFGDAIIGVPLWCTTMVVGNQQKNSGFTFSIKAVSFHSRTSLRVHKHTFSNLKWLHCWKSRGDFFFIETAFLLWCHALWKLGSSKRNNAMGLETCTKIFFCLSSTWCK